MDRTSDFVRPADVLDPDRQPRPGDKVDFDGTAGTRRGLAVTLICVVAVLTLAALQPHARHFYPSDSRATAPSPVAAALHWPGFSAPPAAPAGR